MATLRSACIVVYSIRQWSGIPLTSGTVVLAAATSRDNASSARHCQIALHTNEPMLVRIETRGDPFLIGVRYGLPFFVTTLPT